MAIVSNKEVYLIIYIHILSQDYVIKDVVLEARDISCNDKEFGVETCITLPSSVKCCMESPRINQFVKEVQKGIQDIIIKYCVPRSVLK